MTSVSSVSGTLSTIMLTNTLTILMMLENSCGRLWPMNWRSVSISFV